MLELLRWFFVFHSGGQNVDTFDLLSHLLNDPATNGDLATSCGWGLEDANFSSLGDSQVLCLGRW